MFGLRCNSASNPSHQVVLLLDMSSSTTIIENYEARLNNLLTALKSVSSGKSVVLSTLCVNRNMRWIHDAERLETSKRLEVKVDAGSPLGDALHRGYERILTGIQDGCTSTLILFADGYPRFDSIPYAEVKSALEHCRRLKVTIKFFAFITKLSRAHIVRFINSVGLQEHEVFILEGEIKDTAYNLDRCIEDAERTITQTILG